MKKTGIPITSIAIVRLHNKEKREVKQEDKNFQCYSIFSSTILGQIQIHRAFSSSINLKKDCISINLYASLTGHARCINSLTLHPSLPLLLSSGDDGYVCLWQYKEKEEISSTLSSSIQDNKNQSFTEEDNEDLLRRKKTNRTLNFLSATQVVNHQVVGAQLIMNQREKTRNQRNMNQSENLHIAISSYDTDSIKFWNPRPTLES